ncbi:hypothetical protein ACIREM_31440 [Streptomyces shenzhenensis]|uniref:hypothetical protein n=1 Tax=Streptomyces shenzhenensis TaxID=943815 RepID=UPI0037F2CEC2
MADSRREPEVFAGLRSHRDRALLAFWVATGARAEELLTIKQGGTVVGEQAIGVLIVHASERSRLVEIRDNLLARILEAEREGWLGEIGGLRSSLTYAEEEIAQLDAQIARKQEAVDLGIPIFREIVARTTAVVAS